MIKIQESQVRKLSNVSRMNTMASNLQLTYKHFSTYMFYNGEPSGSFKRILFSDAVNWYVYTASVTNEWVVLVE